MTKCYYCKKVIKFEVNLVKDKATNKAVSCCNKCKRELKLNIIREA
jgi:NAD-dependent SIR2 family protein deacetylase